MIDVHLKRKVHWWNGEKLCNVRKISSTLNTLHLEIIDDQGYVVVSYDRADQHSKGLIFPIKESVEWVAMIRARQRQLPQNAIEAFMEEYNDYCQSDDKEHWVPKRLSDMFKKKK